MKRVNIPHDEATSVKLSIDNSREQKKIDEQTNSGSPYTKQKTQKWVTRTQLKNEDEFKSKKEVPVLALLDSHLVQLMFKKEYT